MKQRAKEEQQIVKTEMANVEESLKEEHAVILECVGQFSNEDRTKYERGCVNLLLNRLCLCEAALIALVGSFGLYHNVVLPNLHLLGPSGTFCINVSDDNSMVEEQNSDSDSDSDSESDSDSDSYNDSD